MTAEENKARVRAFYEKAVNQGDLSAVDELVSDGEVIHLSGDAVGRNTPDSVKKWVKDLRAAFPDIHVTVEEFFADGDKLVNRVTYRGTQGRMDRSGLGTRRADRKTGGLDGNRDQPFRGRQERRGVGPDG